MRRRAARAPLIPGRVRIIAGRLRGSRLAVVERADLRPTPDRVRETLFNWLAPVLEGARCLDLFAGTGALGIEAMSRGAAQCVFVERDPELADLLRANLDRLHVEGAQVESVDALSFLAGPARSFDLVFLDPPFAAGLWSSCAARLEQQGWLHAGALVYFEAPADAAFELPAGWRLYREARAGAVRYGLYRRSVGDPLS